MNTPSELEYSEPIDYTDLDSKHRIKSFAIEYDEEVIEQLIDKVKESKEYLNKIK